MSPTEVADNSSPAFNRQAILSQSAFLKAHPVPRRKAGQPVTFAERVRELFATCDDLFITFCAGGEL